MSIKEIYCRMPSDKNYVGVLDTANEVEQILQRIRVILGTKPGDVLGDHHFGVDLNKYIFSMSFNTNEVKQMLIDAIGRYANPWPEKYIITVDLNYGHDHYNKSDYALIDIIINQKKIMGIIVS